MTAYYNEIDPYAAQWLRNLIDTGHIPAGDVDERSIKDVAPDDLSPYTQCHFFAGIGGWAHAARLAGIPDNFPLWTGSCPCQPFSAAGKRRGADDERHLWPEFYRLIRERRPDTIVGEQVSGAMGRTWLDAAWDDMQQAGYAFHAVDLCASVVGSPRRARLFWLAHTDSDGERGMPIYAQASRLSATTGRSAKEWYTARGVVQSGDELSPSMVLRRGYGNAIDPVLAARFLVASGEALA
jgi:DNA (cytosine-5)-methyltransferase 1